MGGTAHVVRWIVQETVLEADAELGAYLVHREQVEV